VIFFILTTAATTLEAAPKAKLHLSDSVEKIQSDLQKLIPIGTPFSDVVKSLQTRVEVKNFNTMRDAYTWNPKTRKNDQYVYLRIYADLGNTGLGLFLVVKNVSAEFNFDKNDRLQTVYVKKSPSGV